MIGLLLLVEAEFSHSSPGFMCSSPGFMVNFEISEGLCRVVFKCLFAFPAETLDKQFPNSSTQSYHSFWFRIFLVPIVPSIVQLVVAARSLF